MKGLNRRGGGSVRLGVVGGCSPRLQDLQDLRAHWPSRSLLWGRGDVDVEGVRPLLDTEVLEDNGLHALQARTAPGRVFILSSNISWRYLPARPITAARQGQASLFIVLTAYA